MTPKPFLFLIIFLLLNSTCWGYIVTYGDGVNETEWVEILDSIPISNFENVGGIRIVEESHHYIWHNYSKLYLSGVSMMWGNGGACNVFVFGGGRETLEHELCHCKQHHDSGILMQYRYVDRETYADACVKGGWLYNNY